MHGSLGLDDSTRAPLAAPPFASPRLNRFTATTQATAWSTRNIDRLPDGTTTLIFRLLAADRADLTVLGPLSRATYKRSSSGLLTVKVVFGPGGGYPFFGVPLDELADRVVPARDLWGPSADSLLDELVALGSSNDPISRRARWDAIERALLGRLHGPDVFEPAAAHIARLAVKRISAGGSSVEEVAGALDISGRSLRRAFGATVGVSPKLYARLARFQRVASAAPVSRGSWSEVALASGYFDQSHLVADFRDLTGLSPAAFMKRRAENDLPRVKC